ncbi:MAG TPA: DNA-3-methyladenine glycosylase I [Caulobacteraceae bacterium]|nr:DNA-3-methyladenine glycosylase I [Caulobacteraceae bacterium]
MEAFAAIWARAAERKGGADALEALIAQHPTKSVQALAAAPDAEWLRAMTRGVFNAGMSWKVVAAKWPAFETAFHNFDPPLNAAMSEEEFDAHLKNASIIRNGRKVASVRDNARLLVELAREHGSASRFFAVWPDEDYVGLVEYLGSRGAGLGPTVATWTLRVMGKPAFILSRDVIAALIAAGVLDRPPSGKRDLRAVQDAFNVWARESGRDLTSISRVLAMSTGPER